MIFLGTLSLGQTFFSFFFRHLRPGFAVIDDKFFLGIEKCEFYGNSVALSGLTRERH